MISKKILLIIILCFIIPLYVFAEEQENIASTNLDEFTEKVIEEISAVVPDVNGYVIHKKDKDIYIDIGKKQGIFLDMEFDVIREGKDITHPVRNDFVGKVEEKIGEIKIVTLRDSMAIGNVTVLEQDKQIEISDKVYAKKRLNKIAILPIFNPKDNELNFTRVLYDLINNKIKRKTTIELVNPTTISQTLREFGLISSNNFLPNKIIKSLGNKLKADVLIMGNVFDLGEEFFLNLRVVSVDDGSVVAVINTNLKKTRRLRAMIYSMMSDENRISPIKSIYASLLKAPETLDPAIINSNEENEVVSHILDRLVILDTTGSIVPSLAESWNVSKDEKIWLINLKQNITFHNGDAFTSKDVKDAWQYEIVNDKNNIGAKKLLKSINGVADYNDINKDLSGIEILDDYTLQITLNEPDPEFLIKLTNINTSIFSQKSLENNVFKNPIGTGTFKFVSQSEEKILLEASRDRDTTSVDQIEFQINPNQTLEFQRFLNKETDYFHVDGNIASASTTQKEKDVFEKNIVKNKFPTVYYVAINYVEPFNNEKIRQALNYAIDRQSFVKNITQITLLSSVLPQDDGVNSEINFPYNFDTSLPKPKKILEDNGFTNYFNQEFYLYYPDTSKTFKLIAEKIQENLIDIGVQVRIQSKTQKELLVLQEGASQPAFILNSFQYIAPLEDKIFKLKKLFSSQNKGAKENYFFSNNLIDSLLTTAFEEKEKEKRNKAYNELENTLLRESPWIFLFSENKKIVKQPYIKNIIIGQDGVNLKKVVRVNK